MDSNGSTNNLPDAPHPDEDCARCGGLMVVEHYIDLQDDTGQIGLTALRCTSCGEVIDRVILENRFSPAPNLIYGTKQRKYAQRVEHDDPDRDEQQGEGREQGNGQPNGGRT